MDRGHVPAQRVDGPCGRGQDKRAGHHGSLSRGRGAGPGIGRPDDGTDPTGFYNVEIFVPLKPQKEWPKDGRAARLAAPCSGANAAGPRKSSPRR